MLSQSGPCSIQPHTNLKRLVCGSSSPRDSAEPHLTSCRVAHVHISIAANGSSGSAASSSSGSDSEESDQSDRLVTADSTSFLIKRPRLESIPESSQFKGTEDERNASKTDTLPVENKPNDLRVPQDVSNSKGNGILSAAVNRPVELSVSGSRPRSVPPEKVKLIERRHRWQSDEGKFLTIPDRSNADKESTPKDEESMPKDVTNSNEGSTKELTITVEEDEESSVAVDESEESGRSVEEEGTSKFILASDEVVIILIEPPGKKPMPVFICKVCGKQFRKQVNITLHLRIHSPNGETHGMQQPPPAALVAAKQPERSLSPVANHKCPICFKSFVLPVNLQKHLRIHGNDNENKPMKSGDSELARALKIEPRSPEGSPASATSTSSSSNLKSLLEGKLTKEQLMSNSMSRFPLTTTSQRPPSLLEAQLKEQKQKITVKKEFCGLPTEVKSIPDQHSKPPLFSNGPVCAVCGESFETNLEMIRHCILLSHFEKIQPPPSHSPIPTLQSRNQLELQCRFCPAIFRVLPDLQTHLQRAHKTSIPIPSPPPSAHHVIKPLSNSQPVALRQLLYQQSEDQEGFENMVSQMQSKIKAPPTATTTAPIPPATSEDLKEGAPVDFSIRSKLRISPSPSPPVHVSPPVRPLAPTNGFSLLNGLLSNPSVAAMNHFLNKKPQSLPPAPVSFDAMITEMKLKGPPVSSSFSKGGEGSGPSSPPVESKASSLKSVLEGRLSLQGELAKYQEVKVELKPPTSPAPSLLHRALVNGERPPSPPPPAAAKRAPPPPLIPIAMHFPPVPARILVDDSEPEPPKEELVCPICQRTFTLKSSLKRHLKKRHYEREMEEEGSPLPLLVECDVMVQEEEEGLDLSVDRQEEAQA